jgi:hypothetical protein
MINKTLSPYRIVDKLGASGMGEACCAGRRSWRSPRELPRCRGAAASHHGRDSGAGGSGARQASPWAARSNRGEAPQFLDPVLDEANSVTGQKVLLFKNAVLTYLFSFKKQVCSYSEFLKGAQTVRPARLLQPCALFARTPLVLQFVGRALLDGRCGFDANAGLIALDGSSDKAAGSIVSQKTTGIFFNQARLGSTFISYFGAIVPGRFA